MLKPMQLEAIDYLIIGTKTKEEIAKLVGTSDRTLYRWLNNDEFKAEWRKRAEDFKSKAKMEVSDRMVSKLGQAMDNILDLANNSTSEKIKLDANIFIWESQLGKATSRIEQTTTDNNNDNNTSVENVQELLNKYKYKNNDNESDNVINLEEKKAK